jgi:hypothetical protein
MKHLINIIIFLLAGLNTYGQSIVRGILKNSNNDPVPYATIYIQGKALGAYSDKTGFFRITDCSKDDVIIVSHVSYESYAFPADTFNNTISVVLKPKLHEIEEIVVQPENEKRPIIGCRTALKKHSFWSMIGCEFSSLIQNPKYEKHVISEIVFNIKRKTYQSSLIKIHVYKNDNGQPGEEIYTGNNKVIIDKQIKDKIHYVPEVKVHVPNDGVFIGYEWLGRITDSGNLDKNTKQAFGPAIVCKKTIGRNIIHRTWKTQWQVLKDPVSGKSNYEAYITIYLQKG